jgi:hypothetical protein
VNEDINEFINSLPTEQTHYGRNKSSKYLSPEFGSIANIYRLFIDLFPEHKVDVKYHLFNKNFKKFNISIAKPKVDICQTCDKFNVQILNLQKEKKFDSINEIKNSLESHKKEANFFYELKQNLKTTHLNDETQGVFCYDFQKNLQTPVTNVCLEYYLRKFYCYNFGVHDLKSNNVVMFLYPENYAKKGCNETISFINYYINNFISSKVKILNIFSDNCFSQNKNKFLWGFYKYLVVSKKFEQIILHYPIPGHSVMEIDSDFVRIEINKKNYGKIYSPVQYSRIIKNTNIKNPFKVISVNYSLSENSQLDDIPIAKVYNYKKKFSEIMKNQLNNCSEVRKISFSECDVKVSLSLTTECNIKLDLFKNNFNINTLNNFMNDLQYAYEKILPISREKLLDIQKLIEFIPKNDSAFYKTLYSLDSVPMPKSQELIHELFDLTNEKTKNSVKKRKSKN